jgi:hypothetical protein
VDKLPRLRAPDFRAYYAHYVVSGVTTQDIRITFCELDQTAKEGAYMEEHCSVTMTPAAARSLHERLGRQLALWDEQFG